MTSSVTLCEPKNSFYFCNAQFPFTADVEECEHPFVKILHSLSLSNVQKVIFFQSAINLPVNFFLRFANNFIAVRFVALKHSF